MLSWDIAVPDSDIASTMSPGYDGAYRSFARFFEFVSNCSWIYVIDYIALVYIILNCHSSFSSTKINHLLEETR